MTANHTPVAPHETAVCVFGGHEFSAMPLTETFWTVPMVDGHPVCQEHMLMIRESWDRNAISETSIKKVIIRRDEQRIRANAEAKLRGDSKTPGWVYYVQIGDLIKIGYTDNLNNRIRRYPPNANLLATHPGTMQTENDMHKKFHEALEKGREWFRPTPRLLTHIATTREQFGIPAGIVKPMRHANKKDRVAPFATNILR